MAKKVKTPEVLPAELDNQQLAAVKEATGLVGFLQGLVPFFQTAAALEKNAAAWLQRAKATPVPTSKDADAAVQQEIRDIRAGRKVVEDHWEITATVNRFHRLLTAKRGVATAALTEAERWLTTVHDRYVSEEKRIAALEQQRLQREADDRARQEREAELAQYELAAIAAEEKSPTLSEREEKFVTRILVNYDPIVAARDAGYRNPTEQASRLLASDKVRKAIEARREAAQIRQRREIIETLPLATEDVEVKPQLNAGDRTTWSARVVDLELLRNAAFTDQTLGIPRDLWVVDQTRLNQYARSLHEAIERWPGVVADKRTTVV